MTKETIRSLLIKVQEDYIRLLSEELFEMFPYAKGFKSSRVEAGEKFRETIDGLWKELREAE